MLSLWVDSWFRMMTCDVCHRVRRVIRRNRAPLWWLLNILLQRLEGGEWLKIYELRTSSQDQEWLVGGLEDFLYFSTDWEWNNHPNWRSPSFFRGVGQPPTRWTLLLRRQFHSCDSNWNTLHIQELLEILRRPGAKTGECGTCAYLSVGMLVKQYTFWWFPSPIYSKLRDGLLFLYSNYTTFGTTPKN